MENQKIERLLIAMLAVYLVVTSLVFVRISVQRNQHLKTFEIQAEALPEAFRFHQIEWALVDSTGTIFVIKKGKVVPLFSKRFSEYYIHKNQTQYQNQEEM